MASTSSITTLFVDIGGVLLTNGWDHTMREQAAREFGLDYDDMNERHHLTFDTYEEGKLTLDEYLSRVVFHAERRFTREHFKAFMFAQSRPDQEMINLIRNLKTTYHLRVASVSNEGRELTVHRIQTFALNNFIDFFVSSCFVHFRKPDADIYRIAIDIAQAQPEDIVYIEDRQMFVEVAKSLGLRAIHHVDYATTREALSGYGLALPA